MDIKITLNNVDEDQDSLLVEIMNFKIKNLKRPREKRAKKILLKAYMYCLRLEKFLNCFKAQLKAQGVLQNFVSLCLT